MILLLCLNIVRENEMPVLFLIFIGPPKDYTWNRFSLDLNGISLKKICAVSYLRLKKFAFYSLSSYHLGVVLEGASDLRVTWVNRLCDQAEKHWIQVLSKGLTFSFPFFFFRGYVLTNFILFFHDTSLDNTNKIPSAGPKGTNYRAEQRR